MRKEQLYTLLREPGAGSYGWVDKVYQVGMGMGKGSGRAAVRSLGQHCKELDPYSQGGEKRRKALSRAAAGPDGCVPEKNQLGNEWGLKRGTGRKSINEH